MKIQKLTQIGLTLILATHSTLEASTITRDEFGGKSSPIAGPGGNGNVNPDEMIDATCSLMMDIDPADLERIPDCQRVRDNFRTALSDCSQILISCPAGRDAFGDCMRRYNICVDGATDGFDLGRDIHCGGATGFMIDFLKRCGGN